MTPGEVVTTVLSALAFVMSVISLGWQIARARADRPKVHVAGIAACTVTDSDYAKAAWEFEISVANTGSEAITIDEVCWIVETPGGPLRVKSSTVTDHMPLRLEGRDSRSWTYSAQIRGTRWDGLTARPSVIVVEKPSRWRRDRGSAQRVILGSPQTLIIPEPWKELVSWKPVDSGPSPSGG